jgi:very-short-patch-repair endonuclease
VLKNIHHAKSIVTIEKCSYGCGNIAKYIYKNGKYSCCSSKNMCVALRKLNSHTAWNKGKTKHTDKRIKNYAKSCSKTKKKKFKNDETVTWNKGKTKYTNNSIMKQANTCSKNRKGYYHTKNYFTNKYGKNIGIKKYNELNKKKGSIDSYIKKYGKNEGMRRFHNSHKNIGYSSKISKKLFFDIAKSFENEKIYFKALNNEFGKLNNKTHEYYFYDFCLINRKKIIEFNGDYYHMNPKIYNKNDFNKKVKKYAFEIWNYNKRKIKVIKDCGFKVLIIWENDYRKNDEKILKKCINFLKG